MSGAILETLVLLCLGVKIIFEVVNIDIVIIETSLGVGSHREEPQVLSGDIKTRYSPILKVMMRIPSNSE